MKSGNYPTSSQATTSKPKPATPKTKPVTQTGTLKNKRKKSHNQSQALDTRANHQRKIKKTKTDKSK